MSLPEQKPDAPAEEVGAHASPGGTYGDSRDDRLARRAELRTTPNDGAGAPDQPVSPPIE